MKSKKPYIVLIVMGVAFLGVIIGLVLYMWYMPHRDVVATEPDYRLSAQQLTHEYLTNANIANDKYLSEDGESKILVIAGVVDSVSKNQSGDQVVLMKEAHDLVGIAFTFTPETNSSATDLSRGDSVIIKGVLRAGPHNNEAIDFISHGVVEKASIYKN